jgi:nucleoside-diphosphate-sugar epimerase
MSNYLITGASGGMGAAICRLLVREKYRVWGIDRLPPASEEGWTFLSADVTDSSAL